MTIESASAAVLHGLAITYALGYLLDVFVQMTVASVLFLELPREGLVTGRLTRHIKRGHGWRRDLARWICFHLLDPFDPHGVHCD